MRKDLARKISFLFFMLFCVYVIAEDVYIAITRIDAIAHLQAAIIFLIPLSIFYVQYQFRLKHVDMVLGCICLLVSMYLILAIGDDYFDWLRGEDHYPNPRRYFGIGSAIIFAMNVMSALMIWSDGKVQKEKATNSKATQ